MLPYKAACFYKARSLCSSTSQCLLFFFFFLVCFGLDFCLFLFLAGKVSFFPSVTVAQSGTHSGSFSLPFFFGAPVMSCRKRGPGCSVFSFFLLLGIGIPGTKHCAEAAPILAVPGSTVAQGGRDQESFQAALTLEMRAAHIGFPNQRGWGGRLPVCYMAAMISWSLLLASCLPSSNACSL